MKFFDFDAILNMDYNQKKSVIRNIAKVANERLKTLERNKIDYYAYERAMHDLKGTGKKRFFTGTRFKSEKQLDIELAHLESFLTAKSSTIRGIKAINQERLQTFKNAGIKIKKKDEKAFLDFLSSNEFKSLKAHADSNNIIEDFATALNEDKFTPKQIMQEYEDFLNSENVTFEQLNEIRKGSLK